MLEELVKVIRQTAVRFKDEKNMQASLQNSLKSHCSVLRVREAQDLDLPLGPKPSRLGEEQNRAYELN